MNIIRQKTTNVAMYLTDLPVIEWDGTFACSDAKLGLSTEDHELVEGPAPTEMFFPQCMTFDGAVWTISDQAWYDRCWSGYCAEYNAKQRALREATYTVKSDPIFFKYQRGEATYAEWIAAIDNIKAQYPYIGVQATIQTPAAQPVVQGAQTL